LLFDELPTLPLLACVSATGVSGCKAAFERPLCVAEF